ncbi:hypothetical protein BH10BAC3_BH10BAC3_12500 [soil metagenome]
MDTILFKFNYEDDEFSAKAIKFETKDIQLPVKFHIYHIVPMFKMFKGPIIVTANPDGQASTFSQYGSIANFKSAAISALYKHCLHNGINMS